MAREIPTPATGATVPALRSLDIPAIFTTMYSLFMLVPVPGIRAVLPLLTALLVVPGVFVGHREVPPMLRRVWRATAALFIACMVVANLLGAVGSPLALASICMFLLIMHWFNPRGVREHLQIWGLGTLLLLVGSLEVASGLGLVILAGWCLASAQLLNLVAHFRGAGMGAGRGAYEVAPVSLRSVWAAAPLLLMVSAAVFVAAPRVRAPRAAGEGLQRLDPRDRLVVQAGFSETVTLRSMADIRQTEGVAFRVTTRGATTAPGELRYRVNVLDDFDGWDWRRMPHQHRGEVLSGDRGTVSFPPRGADSALGPADWYEIAIVDLPGGVMPLPESTRAVDGIPSGRVAILDEDGRLGVGGGRTPLAYAALATAFPASDADFPLLRGEPLDVHSHVPPPLADILRRSVRHVIPNPAAATGEKARVLQSWLRRNGVYTMEVGGYDDGPVAIRQFLEGGLRGHCELFATAYALLLRSEGIPTRLVTGFSPPGGDRPGAALDVRHRDAHAWVEAWLPGRGWVAFDPTPSPVLSTGGDMVDGKLVATQAAALLGAFDQYGYESQRRAWTAARAASLGFLRTWEHGALLRAGERIARNAAEPAIWLAALLLALLNGAAWIALGRRRRVAGSAGGERATGGIQVPPLLSDILRTLGAHAPLRAHESPASLIAATAERRGLAAEDARSLARLYDEWRYGGADRALEREIRAHLRTLARKR